MCHLIHPNQTIKQIFPHNGKAFVLDELQEYVGGMIEIIKLRNLAPKTEESLIRIAAESGIKQLPKKAPDSVMVINEEGKILQLAFNFMATIFADVYSVHAVDKIVGNVIVCPSEMIE